MRRLHKPDVLRAAAALVVSLMASAAFAQSPAQRGRALLQERCASCHAIGKTGNSAHEAAPAFRTLGRSYDLDRFARRLQRGLEPGHPDMPAFRFSEADAHAVSAYLRTIQK